MTIEKILYQAEARATGGRDGRAVSSDEQLNVKLTTPRPSAAPAVKAPTRSNCSPPATPPASSAPSSWSPAKPR